MNSFADLSVNQLRRAVIIKERLTKLESQLEEILGGSTTGRAPGRRGRKRRSAATRAKMAAAQKARWAGKNGKGPVAGKKGRRKMSAAWRAKIAASARARWKTAKAAGKTRL